MPTPNLNRDQYRKRKTAFETWLAEQGAEVLVPTNEWELTRFRTDRGTSIVYTNKHGFLKWTGESAEAFLDQVSGMHRWRAVPRTQRHSRSSPTCQALRQRDGNHCFYCHLDVDPDDESVEHLGALTQGFPDHISNMVLAHTLCNQEAGHRSIMEKIALRETNRERLATIGANLPETDLLTEREDAAIHDLFDRSEWPPADNTPPWSNE